MICGWKNKKQIKWMATWLYQNNAPDFYHAPVSPQSIVIKGENPGSAHLYKFLFKTPYSYDQTSGSNLTETPIEGKPVDGSPADTVYALPAQILHNVYGNIDVCTENPVFCGLSIKNGQQGCRSLHPCC